jgi:hypothetical protein
MTSAGRIACNAAAVDAAADDQKVENPIQSRSVSASWKNLPMSIKSHVPLPTGHGGHISTSQTIVRGRSAFGENAGFRYSTYAQLALKLM